MQLDAANICNYKAHVDLCMVMCTTSSRFGVAIHRERNQPLNKNEQSMRYLNNFQYVFGISQLYSSDLCKQHQIHWAKLGHEWCSTEASEANCSVWENLPMLVGPQQKNSVHLSCPALKPNWYMIIIGMYIIYLNWLSHVVIMWFDSPASPLRMPPGLTQSDTLTLLVSKITLSGALVKFPVLAGQLLTSNKFSGPSIHALLVWF